MDDGFGVRHLWHPICYRVVTLLPMPEVPDTDAHNVLSTISASARMNAGSLFNVGTLRKFVIPDASATFLYRISSSYNVSTCSETKLMGTTSTSRTPFSPSCLMTLFVSGSSHLTGPILL